MAYQASATSSYHWKGRGGTQGTVGCREHGYSECGSTVMSTLPRLPLRKVNHMLTSRGDFFMLFLPRFYLVAVLLLGDGIHLLGEG